MGEFQLLVVGEGHSRDVAMALSEEDVAVHQVSTVEEAVSLLQRDEFQCVLGVPSDDDDSSILTLRDRFPDLPLVILVEEQDGKGGSQWIEDLLNDRATDYVRASALEAGGTLLAHRVRMASRDGRRERRVDCEVVHDQIERSLETLTAVQEATTDLDLDVEETIDRVLEIGSRRLGYPIGYFTRIESDTQVIVAATGEHDHLQPGMTDPLGQTYCRRTVEADEPIVLEDAPAEGWDDDPAFERFGLRCYVGAQVIVDDEVYGTLCFADERPRGELVTDVQQATVKALAQQIGHELERQRYETRLERNRERLRSLFDQAPDSVIIHDEDGEITDVNETAVDALGYPRAQLLSMNVLDVEVGIDPEQLTSLWRSPPSERPLTLEGVYQRADGGTYPVEVWIDDLEFEGERRFIAMARDISERRRREQELRQFREAVDQTAHAVYITDVDGRIEYVNPAFEEVTGYEEREVRGETPRLLKSGKHDDDLYSDLWQTILSGERWHNEMVDERKDGETIVLDQTISPISAADDDAIEKFVAVARDVTERKTYERRLKRQRDTLEILNQVVRHDIRNDLQLVLAYAEMLDDHVDEEGREYIQRVLSGARGAVGLVERARDVAEVTLQSEVELDAIRLRYVLEGEIDDVRSAYENAVVTVDGSIPRVSVLADDMLGSLFRNLLINAIEHNDAAVPTVTVSATRQGDHVVVRVADNGPGITDDRKDVIFEEGEKGIDSEGTGLGLYLIRRLVDRYGGDVGVTDNEPRGSVFTVSLQTAEN